MEISTRLRQDVSIIDCSGRLTASDGGAQLRRTVETLLKQGSLKILLNLQGLNFMDSSGLGELVRAKNLAAGRGAVLKLVHVEGRVQDVMALANATSSFKIYNVESTAVSSYR